LKKRALEEFVVARALQSSAGHSLLFEKRSSGHIPGAVNLLNAPFRSSCFVFTGIAYSFPEALH